jgi:import receptor subunit TOM70
MALGPASAASSVSMENSVMNTSNLSTSSSASIWDRISKWVSENKVLVYTIAGVAIVVTSAGVVYYLSDTSRPDLPAGQPTEKRKSKRERRREKKKAEEEKRAEKATPVAQSGMWSV